MTGNIGVCNRSKALSLRKNQKDNRKKQNPANCVSNYQQMLPFTLSVPIYLTVQIFNRINVVMFQPHALDYPRLPADFTCLLLLASLSHKCSIWSCMNPRQYLIKSLFNLSSVFYAVFPWGGDIAINISESAASTIGCWLKHHECLHSSFSIFALWSHLVTIHSGLE